LNGRLSGGTVWLVYGLSAIALMFVMAPLLVVVVLSFSNTQFVTFPPHGFTLNWYRAVLENQQFLSALEVSILLASAATIGSLAIGLPAALALSRGQVPGGQPIQAVLLSPLIFPVLITGFALLKFLSTMQMQNAAINLFFGHVLITSPYVVRTALASMLLVDRSLEEAASTLGASRWRLFWLVTLPQIAPGVIAGALFAFMVSFDDYPLSMWLSNAQTMPLPVLLYNDMQNIYDPSIAAMASLMILIGAMLVIALEKLVGLRRAMGV
jgi:putative spermidine/putrescine transport system permease protein